jgi:hypothetical protein
MVKKKQFRELTVYSVFLLLGSSVMILRSFDVKIPNPNDLIIWIYSPTAGFPNGFVQ